MIKLRTGYSFRKAIGKFDDYISLLKEAGETYAPITDRASTYGWMRWIKICKKNELKPVLGIELGVSPDPTAKKPIVDYWTFFPDGEDISPLNRLAKQATSQFRYQPLLTYHQAATSDGVTAIIGSRTLLDKLPDRGPGRQYYAALSPSVSRGYYKEINRKNIPWVASGDNYFPRPEDLGLYQVIAGRGAMTQTWPQWWLSRNDWHDVMSWVPQGRLDKAMIRADAILSGATGKPVPARLPVPINAADDLASLSLTGAIRLGLVPLNKTYRKRLAKELNMIQNKDFGDYFLIVADIVDWAKKRMIVGPARGSAAGSLVCYLMGITDVDPIPHGLIFERFINVNRMDLPDIDIDFSYQQRHLVINYIKDTYGHDHVSQLGTVSAYKPRSALRETSGALRIPIWKTADALDSMIERSSGDARAMHHSRRYARPDPGREATTKTTP